MITRTFGKFFRGNATPFQLMAACILAAALGFMPGFAQAPGLILALLLLLVILNANLALAALVGLSTKVVSLLLLPASFAIGRVLLDGPTGGLFRKMINAPVLAWFGLDYYVATGGLVLGIIFGIVVGYLMVRAVTAFRRKMVELEEGSERYQHYTKKGWVKFLIFVFVGGNKGKKTYQELLATKVGNPIRPLGVVFAVLVTILLVVLVMFASEPIVTYALHRGLERANGATVDLQSANLDLKNNRLTISGLAMADPNALQQDLFRAAKIEADVSGMNLLKKRMQLDRVQVSDASYHDPRKTPGHLVGPPPEPTSETKPEGDAKTIDDYIRSAKEWKERLAQVRRWLEKMSGSEEGKEGGAEKDETLQERLEREIREKGYARVQASHLIEGAPTLTITELLADKVRVPELGDETLDIAGHNLSTHPRLLGKSPEITVKSSRDTLGFATRVGEVADGGTNNNLQFHYRGLSADRVAQQLKLGGNAPFQGGTIDLNTQGSWTTRGGVTVELPLQVTLRNTTLSVAGATSTKVESLVLPIGVKGPIDNPKIMVDQKALSSALAQAGISQVKEELKGKVQQQIGDKVGDKVPGEAKGVLKGILGGKEKKP